MEFARIRFGTKVHHAISSPGGSIDLDTAVRKGQPKSVLDMATKAHNGATSSSARRRSCELHGTRYRDLDSRLSRQHPPRAGRREVVLSQGIICAELLLE